LAVSRPGSGFIDHYYTLGLDLDANGEMAEEAYWRIIRDWRTEKGRLLSTTDVENLNEAYRVLGSPALRAAYDAERAKVLGPNAKPGPPPTDEPEEPPPLRVMEKQSTVLQPVLAPAEPAIVVRPRADWFPVAATFAGIAAMIALAIIRLFL